MLLFPTLGFVNGNLFLPVYTLLIIIFLGIIFLKKSSFFLKTILFYEKYSTFKCIYWILILSFCSIIFGFAKHIFYLNGLVNSFLGGLICSIILPMLLIFIVTPRYIKIENIIKIFYIFIYAVFLVSIVEFFAYKFNIFALQDFVSIFSNKRLLLDADLKMRFYGFYGIPRLRSIFEEPSYLGYFSFLVSPFVYEIPTYKFQLVKNKAWDIFIKKTITPALWFSIICSQSPIWLVFNAILFLYVKLFLHNELKTILKNFIPILSSSLIVFIIVTIQFYKIDLSKTYLVRIINAISNINSLQAFIAIEPSLGTRIITYLNAIDLGIKHSFLGCGYGNMGYLMIEQLKNSQYPLTEELYKVAFISSSAGNINIFVKLFSELGIAGVLTFYCFIIKLFYDLKQTVKKYLMPPIEHLFCSSGSLFCIVFICSTIYDSNFHWPMFYIIFALQIVIILKYKTANNKEVKW